MVSVLLNAGLNLWLNQVMGFGGLALGTSIAATFNALVLLAILAPRIGGFEGARVLVAFLKITVASAAMAIAASVSAGWVRAATPGGGTIAELLRVFVPMAIALAVLAAASLALQITEFAQALQRVTRRFRS
jgi:peptidoglycan biosynthesis protein MviN/MurJ (putative lipid II flippase)